MLQQAKNSEEKAKKAMVDAARLADELRAEQDHTRFTIIYNHNKKSPKVKKHFFSQSSSPGAKTRPRELLNAS